MNLLLPISLQSLDCAELPFGESLNPPSLQPLSVAFEELLAGLPIPSEADASAAKGESVMGSSGNTSTSRAAELKSLPVLTDGSAMMVNGQEMALPESNNALDRMPTASPLLEHCVEEKPEDAYGTEHTITAAPAEPLNSLFPHIMNVTADGKTAPRTSVDTTVKGLPGMKANHSSTGDSPVTVSHSIPEIDNFGHVRDRIHLAGKESRIFGRDIHPLTASSPSAADEMPGDRKGLGENLPPSDTPSTFTAPDIRSAEQTLAAGGTGHASSISHAQMVFTGPAPDAASGESGPEHMKSGSDGAGRAPSEKEISGSLTDKHETTRILADRGRATDRTPAPISGDDSIPAPRHVVRHEPVHAKFTLQQNEHGDTAGEEGRSISGTNAAADRSIPITTRPATFANAEIRSMTVRNLPETDYEFPYDDRQSNGDGRRSPLPNEAHTFSEGLRLPGDTAGRQADAAEPLPSHELPRIHDDAKNNMPVMTKKGDASLELSVDTDGAGELRIELMLNRGVIHGQIHTADEMGKNLIEKNLSGLLQALIHDGIQVGNFSVFLRGKQSGMRDGETRDESDVSRIITPKKIQGAVSRDRLVSIFV